MLGKMEYILASYKNVHFSKGLFPSCQNLQEENKTLEFPLWDVCTRAKLAAPTVPSKVTRAISSHCAKGQIERIFRLLCLKKASWRKKYRMALQRIAKSKLNNFSAVMLHSRTGLVGNTWNTVKKKKITVKKINRDRGLGIYTDMDKKTICLSIDDHQTCMENLEKKEWAS